ncbi:MAG: DUF4430 domain-containing protein [Candidatus Bathyarchaeia archaeon]
MIRTRFKAIIILGSAITLAILLPILHNILLPIPHENGQQKVSALIAVTVDYGRVIIREENVTLKAGTSALDALKQVARVETAYGGGFVLSIDGIRSRYPERKLDWFFYVNGFLAREGASSYIIRDGDSIQWDYHRWGTQYHESAILGVYPQHFTKGYAGRRFPTIILYEDNLLEEAKELHDNLSGRYGVSVTMVNIEAASEEQKSNSNVILLATSGNRLVSELSKNRERIGFYVWFHNGKVAEFDCSGKLRREYDDAGVIQVTQNIWNIKGTLACENIILLISGTSLKSIKESVHSLIGNSKSYKYAFGIIVSEGTISRIPFCPEDNVG